MTFDLLLFSCSEDSSNLQFLRASKFNTATTYAAIEEIVLTLIRFRTDQSVTLLRKT